MPTSHQISQDFVIYICLSHFMKAVSRNVKKHIKSSNIHFVMYSISVLANTKDQSTFLLVLNRFFILLLSPTKTEMMEHAVSFLEEKIENIGHENNCLIIDENKDSFSGNKVFLEKIKTKNQKQFICNKASAAFFIKKLKRYLTVLKRQ